MQRRGPTPKAKAEVAASSVRLGVDSITGTYSYTGHRGNVVRQ